MSRQDLHDPVKSDRCHGGARKGAGRPKKALESGKITRLRLFEETARKWKSLQFRAKFSTHEEFASHLLQRYEADLTHSADVTQQIQVISSQLLDSLAKLETQSNTGSKKRKPAKTIHIDPCGSALLVKNSQKVQSIPKELHHSIQHVRTSLYNLNQELESYVNSKEDVQTNADDICDVSGDEEGILAIRTCKSQEDRLPPIGNVSNIHVVNILNPKTPQKLYYTSQFNYAYVNSEHDTTDSSSSTSSSEGFVPPHQSTNTKYLSLTDCQDSTNLKVEGKTLEPSGTESRSCSPQPAKVSGQQQGSLKQCSVNIVKLPPSIITSRNTNVIEPIHDGMLSSDELNDVQIDCNLISMEGTECAELNTASFNQEILTEQRTEPTTKNDLLCKEEMKLDEVSCMESDISTSKKTKDVEDDLDHSTLPTDCNDYIHSEDKVEVVVHSDIRETDSPPLQENCDGDSSLIVSLPNSKQEGSSDKLTHKESSNPEIPSKQQASNIKNVALPQSDTECEDVEPETLAISTSSKDTAKQHSKKIKSEKYVVSSCSENETDILSDKPLLKPNSKHCTRKAHHHTSSKHKSNIPIPLSGSDLEECSSNMSPCEGDKDNPSQSILSYLGHEETEIQTTPKVHTDKIHISGAAAKQTASSSLEQNFTAKHEHLQQQASHSVDITSEIDDKARIKKSNLVRRKLNMTEYSKEKATEETDDKKQVTKYKLRSKENSISKKFSCISCKGTVNMSYSYKVHKHPRFSAYMCEKCWKLYTNGKFTVDELDGHEEYCCICGEGGEIVCCDFCHNSVCQVCIQRIAGKDYLDNILGGDDVKWECFSCNTSFLRVYAEFYFQNTEINNMSKNCNSTADDEVEVEAKELFSESFSSSDVSGIATDEVSMSDTELCGSTEDHFSKRNSSSSNTDASTRKLPLSNNKRKKRTILDTFLESDDSSDNIAEQVTLLSDSEQVMVPPVIDDPINLPSPLNYSVKSSCEHTSSDSEPTVSKKPKSFRKRKLVSESSHKMSPNDSDGEERVNVKWYSTRSKAYKGDELDGSAKSSVRKRKRRNVQVLSSESESDADGSKPATPGRKRRKLRKLIDDDKLDVETRRAQKDEELRLKRIKEKEKHSKGEESDQLVLDSSGDIIDVEPTIASHLKPHQREGVKFLWDCCCENLERLKTSQGSGAILAHCMGLGKSLQVIAFIEALLRNKVTNIEKVAIIVPVNTLENWKNELVKWIPEHKRPRIYHLAMSTSLHGRLNELQDWFDLGGILLCGYEMYRNLASGKGRGFKSKTKVAVAKYLLDPGPDIVVCDEGHVLKNPKSVLSQSLNKLRTLRRIVLTGTPLQNNLLEYYTMVSFVKPKLLGTQKEFSNRFVNPIKNGQCRDSSAADVRLMRYRSHVLHKLLNGCVQRHDYRVLTRELPPKQEYVVLFRLSSVQETLYTTFLEKQVDHSNLGRSGNLFTAYQILFKIWNHPWILRLRDLQKKEEEEELASGESLRDFIVSGSEDESIGSKEDHTSDIRKKHAQSSNIIVLSDSEEVVPVSKEPKVSDTKSCSGGTDVHWYGDIFTDDMETNLELSGKLMFLFNLLEETHRLDEKVLVFSQSLLTLDLIETFLQLPELGEWCRGLDYLRIDGSTSAGCRSYCVDTFNSVDNPKTRLFLISTKAGSLGVNLTAANRVVIFDASWNPTNDLQAIFRTYRYGQTKPVFIYRLLSKGTMEEKIYERQVTKESLSLRVVDEKQIGRHFSQAELSELFEYSPAERRENPDPSLSVPKEDVILCKLLKKLHPEWIAGFHEHDSLLEHRFAEELTEEEQQKAWENYEAKRSETVDYVNRAVLMSQLHQQQNHMLATGVSLDNPGTSNNSSYQPIAMPYRNQPQPPGTTGQGVDNVVQMAFQRCQELNSLYRTIANIDNELKKPNVSTEIVREAHKKRMEYSRCYKYLEGAINLISMAIQSYGAYPSYQAKLAAAKQFILDSIRNASVKT